MFRLVAVAELTQEVICLAIVAALGSSFTYARIASNVRVVHFRAFPNAEGQSSRWN
jgi:hypothetical protein